MPTMSDWRFGSPAEDLESLSEIEFALRALRTLLAYRILLVPDIDDKIVAAHHLFRTQVAFRSIAERVDELAIPPLERGFSRSEIPANIARNMADITASATSYDLASHLLQMLESRLAESHHYLVAPSRLALEQALAALMSVQRGNQPGSTFRPIRSATHFRATRDWWADLHWPLLPTRPARDSSLRVILKAERQVAPGDIAAECHSKLFDIEIQACEVCAGLLLAVPSTLPGLEHCMARQCWDEGRHAEVLLHVLRDRSCRLDQYPIHFGIWDTVMGETELPERLAAEQVIYEAYHLGNDIEERKRFIELGEPLLGRIFEWIHADETYHARAGLACFRRLGGRKGGSILRSLESKLSVRLKRQPDPNLMRYAGFSDAEISHLSGLVRDEPLR